MKSLKNYTIPEFKEYLLTVLNNFQNRSVGQTFLVDVRPEQLIDYWNTNNDTATLDSGNTMFFQIINFYSIDHFKLHISVYLNNAQYELTCTAGKFSKIKPILIANVDDNNKSSLFLSGNLTVNGTINGTASSAVGLKYIDILEASNYTIVQLKQYFESKMNTFNNYDVGKTLIINCDLYNLINYWNTNNEIDKLGSGPDIYFQITNFYSIYNFKFLVTCYSSGYCYELTRNGLWKKFIPLALVSVDDTNKYSLTLSGDLTVAGTINGTDFSTVAKIQGQNISSAGYIFFSNNFCIQWAEPYIRRADVLNDSIQITLPINQQKAIMVVQHTSSQSNSFIQIKGNDNRSNSATYQFYVFMNTWPESNVGARFNYLCMGFK